MEANWGPDAAEFRPDRFLVRSEDTGAGWRFQKPSPFVFSAFQAGRRTCLGIDMAYLEIKIAVITLCRKFRFSLCEGVTIAYERSLTLPMRDLRVDVSRSTNVAGAEKVT